MAIIDSDFVKARWAQWCAFCTLDDYDPDAQTGRSPDEVLAQAVLDAEVEMLGYVEVTTDGVTEAGKLRAVALAKKRAFDQKHGDDGFQFSPQILKDYAAAIAELEQVRDGDLRATIYEAPRPPDDLDAPGALRVSIRSKERVFGESFR